MISTPDLHIHTHYCGHASGTLEESVLESIHKNIPEIGFAGHLPYPSDFQEPEPNCVISDQDFPNFIEDVTTLQKEFRDQIKIYLAAEIDCVDQGMDETFQRLKNYNFDYVLGSVHLLNGIPIDYNEEYLHQAIDQFGNVEGLWEAYFQQIEKLIHDNQINIVAHLDLLRKLSSDPLPARAMEHADFILDQICEHDLVMEVNTGGIDRSKNKEPYPAWNLLKRALEKKIEITLGSDAHHPSEVGRYFQEAAERIKAMGRDKIIIFSKRKKEYRTL